MSVMPWLLAFPLTAIVMGGWRRLIPVIFKKRSRELFSRMQRLVALARLMVFHAVLETYGSNGTDDAAHRHAEEIVRYFFNDPEETHGGKNLFGAATKIEAMLWLDANSGWRELVLQTLKMQMIARGGMGEDEPDDLNNLISSPVFQAYEKDYPMKVDPESYTELVAQVLAKSSDTLRVAVRNQFGF